MTHPKLILIPESVIKLQDWNNLDHLYRPALIFSLKSLLVLYLLDL